LKRAQPLLLGADLGKHQQKIILKCFPVIPDGYKGGKKKKTWDTKIKKRWTPFLGGKIPLDNNVPSKYTRNFVLVALPSYKNNLFFVSWGKKLWDLELWTADLSLSLLYIYIYIYTYMAYG
jgi:hypothetical protein